MISLLKKPNQKLGNITYLGISQHLARGSVDEGQRGHPEVSFSASHRAVNNHAAHHGDGGLSCNSGEGIAEEFAESESQEYECI